MNLRGSYGCTGKGYAMWIFLAFLSALFAGLTSVLAKIGLKNTDSNVATALRTIVVVVFSWALVFVSGAVWSIGDITLKSLFFLILSGIATGASWICYFRALQLGDVNKVVPIDKASTILSMIFAISILGETDNLILKIIGMLLIGTGTFMMVAEGGNAGEKRRGIKEKLLGSWLVFALLSAVFAAFTSILGKVGIENVDSNLGTAIRTLVVLVMAWVVVFMQKKQDHVKSIDKKSWAFILFSGLATGLSWLCYYKALQDGEASVVVPIDKLSVLITAFFAVFVLKEKMSKKALIGLAVLTAGTLVLLIRF